jgi:hypothetical protein
LLSRIGEISETQQIRIADNETRLRDLDGLHLDPAGVWIDETGAGRNAHDLAQPLTGAIFDIFVEIFQERLAQRGLIPAGADARGWTKQGVAAALEWFDRQWGAVFFRFEPDFRDGIVEARNIVGSIIALVMDRIDPNDLTFARIAALFLEASLELGQGRQIAAFRQIFLERDIVPETRASSSRVRVAGRSAHFARPRSPCFADRIAASQRARRLANLQQAGLQADERHTERVDRLLRREHRGAGWLR